MLRELDLPDRMAAGVARTRWWLSGPLRGPRGLRLPTDAEAKKAAAASTLRLSTTDSPEVSVIVPVYGQLAVTWTCLRSLSETRAGVQHEVIVVDDKSPDETPAMLRMVEGLRVVTNPENLGFIGACNAGAAVARGRYLVFLNNDTTVTEGWLAALVETFALHPRTGIVGGLLLFPDGRIQEAGGTVFRDGSGSHFGRNRRPGPSRFAFVRAVDYVSGACLAIPRELFKALNGFDSYYHPAYYEDTDLAFRVRDKGYSVLYQPRCVVFHYEGQTHGTDVKKGKKRHQVINQSRFFERWQSTLLAEHPAPGRRTRRSAERNRGPRLLVGSDAAIPAEAPLGEATLRFAHAAQRAGYRVSWAGLDAPLAAATQVGDLGIEPLVPPEHPSWTSVVHGAIGQIAEVVVVAAGDDVAAHLEFARDRMPEAQVWLLTETTVPRSAAERADAVVALEGTDLSSLPPTARIKSLGAPDTWVDELRAWTEKVRTVR